MATFVISKHPVTTLVTVLNNPNKLTNDLLIIKKFDNNPLCLPRWSHLLVCVRELVWVQVLLHRRVLVWCDRFICDSCDVVQGKA